MNSIYKNVEYATASKPIFNLYSQNLDFSMFPLLCDFVYRELKCVNPQIIKLLPFCAFMHAMTTCLNAWLFNTVTHVNGENRYNLEEDAMSLIPKHMLIPRPIAEYLATINTVITPSGETVCVNVPDSCLPQTTVRDDNNKDLPEIPPGSFGSVTSNSHNAYECYVSPYITRRLFEATREQTEDYMPLPKGHFPPDTFPNKNLLGYFVPEKPTVEGLDLLKKYTFPNTDNMVGRLQCILELMIDVSYLLLYCCDCYHIVNFHKIQRYSRQTSLVWTSVDVILSGLRNPFYITEISGPLCSAYAFRSTTAAQATLFALRRKRNDVARGLCYTTIEGYSPEGWTKTINDNFNMIGQYAPEIGTDHSYLRERIHQMDMPIGCRTHIINNWVKIFTKSNDSSSRSSNS